MKKILYGKLYNTETADKLGRFSSGHDFYEVTEVLYRKKNGEFFLYGSGGAASAYFKWDETGNRCAGEDIIPLSIKEAKEWAEEYLDVDSYMNIFGSVEE